MWHGFKLGFFVLAVVFFLSYSSGDFSSANNPTTSNESAYSIDGRPSGLLVTFLVFDIESGETLIEQNSESVLPIASVTKLFTANSLLTHDLTSTTTITYSDVMAEEDFGKLVSGEEYLQRELLFPLLLESSNDAAKHFERITKGGVVEDMNTLAKALDLSDTTFADASGLSPKNVSTAKDLSKFLSYLAKEQSHVLDITTLPQYVGPYTGWVNNSPVFNLDGFKGGKHGYTKEAGRTGAFIFEENFNDKKRTLGYILLGSQDLTKDMADLREFVHTHVRYE